MLMLLQYFILYLMIEVNIKVINSFFSTVGYEIHIISLDSQNV